MRIFFQWIYILMPFLLVNCQPLHNHGDDELAEANTNANNNAQNIPKLENVPKLQQDQIISVRITSSVAVGRGRAKSGHKINDNFTINSNDSVAITSAADPSESVYTTVTPEISTALTVEEFETITEVPPSLIGANIEYIKQLKARKGTRGVNNFEQIHSFQHNTEQVTINDTQYTVTDPTIPTTLEPSNENYETTENVPLARSVPLSYSNNYIQDLVHKALEEHSPRLTTVSFNVLHDAPQRTYNEPSNNAYINSNPSRMQEPTFTNNAPQVYSQPSKIYSEPAKFYSEPAKIYSEPAKIYSEPAKVYSEPAKIYSEPAKFYSQPASLHLPPETPPSQRPWAHHSEIPNISSTLVSTTPLTAVTIPAFGANRRRITEQQPEKNYEVDEKVSVMTDGRTHGVQPSDPENCKQEKCKVGYVVEGRQFRKYRVEERTSDGFIVGEYGVVRNEDGALRGVRYTADSDASPRLIHDALMKFLQLK
ncbi:uncharacterized protein [Epargyreus clarus]|uniref:uncharacterized protein n=1 Tax=Epargyreus clarus TaxID=520877 RepID=UPI003C2C05CB